MSVDEWDAAQDRYLTGLYNEYGPEWVQEHYDELYKQYYEEAVKEFTAERLKSYYVARPDLAAPALDFLLEAQSLLASHPRASLVIATAAVELAIKTVLLKPIVFGLVHTEGMAVFITDLATQHTGMERFQTLLTEILTQFGGVDLKTYKRPDSAKTLWQEIGEVQKVRNAVIHRGEQAPELAASLAVSVASTILKNIFPQVLAKLDLHLHDPWMICGKTHGVTIPVYFYPIPDHVPSIAGSAEVDVDDLDYENMPDKITGKLKSNFSNEALEALHSAACVLPMCILNTLIQYNIRLAPESNLFTGTKAAKRGE